MHLALIYLLLTSLCCGCLGNEDAKRLFDDLLRSYNRLRRPVKGPDDKIVVKFKLRLAQIIDLNEKDQIMMISVWLNQEWEDPKFVWDPNLYGGVKWLYVPSDMIWVPDIVLYNNANRDYHITINTKATIFYNGTVRWRPPAIYESLCQIDVQWFPFDTQTCDLKFGCWTYDYSALDLQHMDKNVIHAEEVDKVTSVRENVTTVVEGWELKGYYPSVEWEIMAYPAKRYVRLYQSCCPESDRWVDITYFIKLRRKPLFYTVNLILPCVGISFLTILVFYLPCDSGEKVALSISILVSLTVFFLLLTEIIPATSVVLPLIGKYLLFTMVMVTISVMVTVVTLNLHFRTPTTHRMPKWIKVVFLQILPKYLFISRPDEENVDHDDGDKDSFSTPGSVILDTSRSIRKHLESTPEISKMGSIRRESMKKMSNARQAARTIQSTSGFLDVPDAKNQQRMKLESIYKSPPVIQAFENLCFIAELLKKQDKDDQIDDDWKFVAMVLDRIFLWIFTATCLAGTFSILLLAPSFYDNAKPIDTETS